MVETGHSRSTSAALVAGNAIAMVVAMDVSM